jgi:RNA-binding protein YlmH
VQAWVRRVSEAVALPVRSVRAVVPSLRVDVLGARAFGVSRHHFAQGIAAGRVHRGGRHLTKADDMAVGDAVVADGLGTFTLQVVEGVTRRGQWKVLLAVSKRAR